ncbi:hypothetical protein L4Z43_000266 [Pseudomonas aeruginosa]|nr:hypothetical protein [Pseudomonas aeruginosa]
MAIIEVVSGGDRRSLMKRFERKSKQQAISELVDFHLLNCARIEKLEAERDAALARVAELERQEPVAWMHDQPNRVDVIHRDVKDLLQRVPGSSRGIYRPLDVSEHYTIPLYAAPVAQAQHSVPEGWMLVECGIWTQEQVDEMQKTVARFRNSEFVDDRALAMAVADAGQGKAPEISLADLLAAAPGKEGV